MHISEVEIIGTVDREAPFFTRKLAEQQFISSGGMDAVGDTITQVKVKDFQGDDVNITLDNPSFTVYNDGFIIVNNVLRQDQDERIIISITDGKSPTITDTVFVTVKSIYPLEDYGSIDHGYSYGGKPEFIMDNDYQTSSMTFARYIQFDLPDTGMVYNLSLYPNNYADGGLGVYITNVEFTDEAVLDSLNPDFMLFSNAPYHHILYENPKPADKIIIRRMGASWINIRELEINGVLPDEPLIKGMEDNLIIDEDLEVGTVIHSFEAVDYQSDELTLSLESDFLILNDTLGLTIAKPISAGYYQNIITVSDGIHTVSYDFGLRVRTIYNLEDFAQLDHVYSFSGYPKNVFDNDNETGNMTSAKYIQIELPDTSDIFEFSIDVGGYADGLGIYFSNTRIVDDEQIEDLDRMYFIDDSLPKRYRLYEKPIQAKYIVIRREGSPWINIQEIEILGVTDETPNLIIFSDSVSFVYDQLIIDRKMRAGQAIAGVIVRDFQNDSYNLTLDSNVLSLEVGKDTSYVIASQDVSQGTYHAQLSVKDVKGNSANKSLMVQVSDFYDLTDFTEFATNNSSSIEAPKHKDNDLDTYFTSAGEASNFVAFELPELSKIYEIEWSGRLGQLYGGSKVYLMDSKPYVGMDFVDPATVVPLDHDTSYHRIGFVEKNARFIVFKGYLENRIDVAELKIKGTLSEIPRYIGPDEIVININTISASIVDTLQFIDYQNDALSYAVDNDNFSIDENGILRYEEPQNLDLTEYILQIRTTDAKGNILDTSITLTLIDGDPVDYALATGRYFVTDIGDLITSFKAQLDVDMDAASTDKKTYISSQIKVLEALESNTLNLELLNPILLELKTSIKKLDEQKTRIFDEKDGYIDLKYWVLIADHIRQEIDYPLYFNTGDIVKTDLASRAYLADHVVYNFRSYAPPQNDLGNFSRSDFSHITPTVKTVNLTSRKRFKSSGVYALPGQNIKVTRSDLGNSVKSWIVVNSLRSGSTKEFENNGYIRPKFLQSTPIAIEPGETIEFSNSYGGPIQIYFNVSNEETEFIFENVGEHPHWSGPEDNIVFQKQLQDYNYDWAEIVTQGGFEIHTTMDNMFRTIDDWYEPNVESVASYTDMYTGNKPFLLAGYTGQGIDKVEAITFWADSIGLDLREKDIQVHMNSDQATCGYGCSGNPYDAYWAFSVIGHGDIHELGHNLERKRIGFSNWDYHAYTNIYPYYTHSRFTLENPFSATIETKSLPYEHVYRAINDNFGQPNEVIKQAIESTDEAIWATQSLPYIQALMIAQKYGDLVSVSPKDATLKYLNGWHLHARLHLLENSIGAARANEYAWSEYKHKLGFSTYSLDEFKEITNGQNNDWMLVSLSYASKLDFRPFMEMYGEKYSDKASKQVEEFGYKPTPQEFFFGITNEHTRIVDWGAFLDKPTIPVDGNWSWHNPIFYNKEDTIQVMGNETVDFVVRLVTPSDQISTLSVGANESFQTKIKGHTISIKANENTLMSDSLLVFANNGEYQSSRIFYIHYTKVTDDDYDGVPNDDDLCPDTPINIDVNSLGCSVEQQELQAPTIFALQSPENNEVLRSNQPTFIWAHSSPILGSDSVNYIFNLASDSLFSNIIHSQKSLADTVYSLVDANIELNLGQYYWKVVAEDGRGFQRSSPTYLFLVETEVTSNEQSTLIPESYLIEQNYPNPFNPVTSIQYGIPVDSQLTIEVYNVLGKKVATLVNGYQKAGYYTVEFNAFNVSSGIYLYKITTPTYSKTLKMLLVK